MTSHKPLPVCPVYDVYESERLYGWECTSCTDNGYGFDYDYKAINAGHKHSHVYGVGSIFSGVIR